MNPKDIIDKVMGQIRPLMDKGKDAFNKLTKPQKIILGGAAGAVLVSFVVFMAYSGGGTAAAGGKERLFNKVYPEAKMQQITSLLETGKIPYELKNGYIYVDAGKRADVIHALVQKGFGLEDLKGWDLFKLPQWGTSEFVNDIKKHQALQQELTRHLKSLSYLANAEVFVQAPAKTIYRKQQQPWKISVVLTPKAYEKLDDERIRTLEKIVKSACSVAEEMNMKITITHAATGKQLNNFDSEISKIKDKVQYAQAIIKVRDKEIETLTERVRDYISRFIHPKRIAVIVAMKVNWDQVNQRKREIIPIILKERTPGLPYDDSEKLKSLIVSQEKNVEEYMGRLLTPGGPPGANSQVPPGYKDFLRTNGKYIKTREIHNHVYSQLEKDIKNQPFRYMRTDISVVLDGIHDFVLNEKDVRIDDKYQSISDEHLKRIKKGIQASIGFDARQGDTVVVENIPFDHEEEKKRLLSELTRRKKITTTLLIALATLFSLFIGVLVFRTISKEIARRKRLREEQLAQEQELMRQAALKAAEEEGIEAEISLEERSKNELLERIKKVAKERPADVANLLRTWIMEES